MTAASKPGVDLPRAILFDLDDTILSAYSRPDVAWLAVADEFSAELAPLSPVEVADAIAARARAFWADAAAATYWRLRLADARQRVVAATFAELKATGRAAPDSDVGLRMADRSRSTATNRCAFSRTRMR